MSISFITELSYRGRTSSGVWALDGVPAISSRQSLPWISFRIISRTTSTAHFCRMRSPSFKTSLRSPSARNSSTTSIPDGSCNLARACCGRRAHIRQFGRPFHAPSTPSQVDENLQLTQLFAPTSMPIFVRIDGNPKFKSETLLGYEVGYRRLITPRFYVDVSVFHNNYNDLTSFGALALSVETSPPPPRCRLLYIPERNQGQH